MPITSFSACGLDFVASLRAITRILVPLICSLKPNLRPKNLSAHWNIPVAGLSYERELQTREHAKLI